MELEEEGFFEIDRLRGEFSRPLKQNSEIDLDSLLDFFTQAQNAGEMEWKLVNVVSDWVWILKQSKYGLYG